jgi:MFS transporter, FHS family, L-fucose permease
VVPLLQGLLADHIGVQWSFVLPLLCYGYITWYGLNGSRLDPPSTNKQQAPAQALAQ